MSVKFDSNHVRHRSSVLRALRSYQCFNHEVVVGFFILILVNLFYNIASKFKFNCLCMLYIPIAGTLMTSANKFLFIQHLNYRVENVIKQMVPASACVHRDMKHAGS